MRSVFGNAPFTRFDLGEHVLGQSAPCPIGQIAVSRDGKVTCIPFSPPSGMFMPQGPVGNFPGGPPTNIGYGSMGQAGMPDPYLTQAQRDKLLLDIQSAVSKTKTIDTLMNWSTANDPGLKKYLGLDASRFNTLANKITPLYETVDAVGSRLADTDAEGWWTPSDQEAAEIRQWTVGVNEMYKIIQNHKALPYTPAYGTKPPPDLSPGTPETGISKDTLMIGGAVAVGIGLLVAVFA